MRFEETEKFAELVHMYESHHRITPKSFVVRNFSVNVSAVSGVSYTFTLPKYSFIRNSSVASFVANLTFEVNTNSLVGFSGIELPKDCFADSISFKSANSIVQIILTLYIPIL